MIRAAETLNDQPRKITPAPRPLMEYPLRHRVSRLRAETTNGGEPVRSPRNLIGISDQLIEVFKTPKVQNRRQRWSWRS